MKNILKILSSLNMRKLIKIYLYFSSILIFFFMFQFGGSIYIYNSTQIDSIYNMIGLFLLIMLLSYKY